MGLIERSSLSIAVRFEAADTAAVAADDDGDDTLLVFAAVASEVVCATTGLGCSELTSEV